MRGDGRKRKVRWKRRVCEELPAMRLCNTLRAYLHELVQAPHLVDEASGRALAEVVHVEGVTVLHWRNEMFAYVLPRMVWQSSCLVIYNRFSVVIMVRKDAPAGAAAW